MAPMAATIVEVSDRDSDIALQSLKYLLFGIDRKKSHKGLGPAIYGILSTSFERDSEMKGNSNCVEMSGEGLLWRRAPIAIGF